MRTIVLWGLFLLFATTLQAAETPKGEELIEAWGCRACHLIDGFGGSLANDLSGVGKRLNAIDIRLKLHPLPGQNQGALMPTYPEMPDEEVTLIATYLAKLR